MITREKWLKFIGRVHWLGVGRLRQEVNVDVLDTIAELDRLRAENAALKTQLADQAKYLEREPKLLDELKLMQFSLEDMTVKYRVARDQAAALAKHFGLEFRL